MKNNHYKYFIIFLLMSSLGLIGQSTPEIILPEDLNGTVKLNLSINSNQEKEILSSEYMSVFVENEKSKYASIPIQGTYQKEDEYLIFKPDFPFERGMNYMVKIKNTDSINSYSYHYFQIDQKKIVEQAKVIGVFPSAPQLPENLLRFYVYFNTPMKKGEVLKHIQLVDADGNIDRHAFMEFKQELWSSDGKRLTVLFDPGRIKRGVSTNTEKGPALLKGNQYHLIISDDWQDVYGQQLSHSTKKTIEVVETYRSKIKVNEWAIDYPKANSHETLVIYFDRIMNHALIQTMIKLVDDKDKRISGYWEILEREQSIIFIPQKKWKKGNYQIKIDSRLEDISGNNLQNPLDHKQSKEAVNNLPYESIEFNL